MLVTNLLRDTADRLPDQPAVWHSGAWTTYAELDQRSERLAHTLRDAGVREGDRVALLLENSPAYVVALFGVLKAGAVAVPLNTDTTEKGLAYLLGDCTAVAAISNRRHARHLIPAIRNSPSVRLAIFDQSESPDYDAAGCELATLEAACSLDRRETCRARRIDIDLASITYTSGSTGVPKGVMLSHLNLVSNTRSIAQYLHLTEADRVLVILPFFYIYGQSLLLTHALVGGSVVIENRFMYPNVALKTLGELEATGFAGVPSTFNILLQRSTLASMTFEKLRYVTQAGGAMAPAVQKEVAEAFAPADLYIMYGATEAAPRLSYLEPADLVRKWGAIGKAIPNVELFVADTAGRPLPPGETGELVARGSNIFQGYWNQPAETARVLRGGAYWTGDLGRSDEEGYLYVVGRASDIIKVKGYRVSAQEVEAALQEHPDVAEVAVVGAADPILGEAIVAFVVARAETELTPEELTTFAKQRLPTYRQPSSVIMLDALPKNSSGKVMKSQLQVPQAAPAATRMQTS